jgi:hypothetical protein
MQFFSMTQQPVAGQDLFIIEASRSQSNKPHPVGLLWKSDQQSIVSKFPRKIAWRLNITGYPGRDVNWEPPQDTVQVITALCCAL